MTIKVTVASGRRVLIPQGDHTRSVPKEPFTVDETKPFWARLLRDGDIVRVPAEAAPAKPATAAAPAGSAPK